MRLSKSLIGSRSSKAVYGIILVTAVVIGSGKHDAEPLNIALKVLFAAIVIVLAEVYSEYLGEKIKRKRALSKSDKKNIVYDASAIFVVSLYPAFIFILSSLGLYSTELAFKITYVMSLIGLGVFGYIASIYAGDSRFVSARRALIAALIGLAVILLKYAFGH